MSIALRCGQCSQTYTVPDHLVGKSFKCKQCNATVKVPPPAPDDGYAVGADDTIQLAPLPRRPPAPEPEPTADPPRVRRRQRVQEEGLGTSTASLIFGICSLFAWIWPIAGIPTSIAGVVTGILGLNTTGRNKAIAGLILASSGLVLALVAAFYLIPKQQRGEL